MTTQRDHLLHRSLLMPCLSAESPRNGRMVKVYRRVLHPRKLKDRVNERSGSQEASLSDHPRTVTRSSAMFKASMGGTQCPQVPCTAGVSSTSSQSGEDCVVLDHVESMVALSVP